jgi:hypothetical protein
MKVLPVIPKRFKFARGATWFFLLLSILLLGFTYYRSEIIFYGANGEKYFKYYVISLAGILFWGGVLRLRGETQANIITVAISLIIGVYTIEGAASLFQGKGIESERIAAAAKLNIEFDDRTVLEVTEDLIAEGVDAVPYGGNLRLGDMVAIKPELLLPLGGVSNKTTVLHNESGQYAMYKSDRHGFNNPDGQWDLPKIEWLLTGDSFTEGAAVQQGEDIAGQIRSITKSSVINIGISGNGPLLELAALKEYGPSLHPKKVLWIFWEGNDFLNLAHEKTLPKLIQYLQDDFSQNLINRQKEIDSILLKYTKTQKILYKTKWMRLHEIRKLIKFDGKRLASDLYVDPLFAKIITEAKDRTEEWGGKLYFVYLPDFFRYNETVDDHDLHKDLHKIKSEIIEMVRGLNIPVIDIYQEVFTDHPDPLALFPLRIRGHYNAEGYSEVAKAIVARIKDEQKVGSEAAK